MELGRPLSKLSASMQVQGPEFKSPAPFWVKAGGCGGSLEVLALEKQR